MSIVNYSDWQRLDAMVEELGGVKALDEAVKAGVAEVHEVTGVGGSTMLARHITHRYTNRELSNHGWIPIRDMANRLGCDPRTINNRVLDGSMERKLEGGNTGGGLRSYVRVVSKR